jgi:hypothetical protein
MKLFPFSIHLRNTDEIYESQSSTGSNLTHMKIYLATTKLQDRDAWVAHISKQFQVNTASTQSISDSPNSKTKSMINDKKARGTQYKRAEPSQGHSFFHLPQPFYLPTIFLGDGIPHRHLFHYSIVYLTPSFIWLVMRHYYIEGKEFVFVLLWILNQRFLILRELGTPLPTTKNHVGPVSFNFTLDLTGVLRFMNNSSARSETNDTTTDTSPISVTSIVIKAVASSLEHVPGL